jgi:hypothetical protein
VPPNRCGLENYVIDVDLHQLADQIMIDVIHGALVRGTGILQPKGHDHVFEQSHGTGYSECSLVYVFWGHENLIVASVAIHETQNLVAGSRIDQCFRNGHWPSFFCTGTMLEIHLTYLHGLMNPASSIFSISFLTSSKTSVLICHANC